MIVEHHFSLNCNFCLNLNFIKAPKRLLLLVLHLVNIKLHLLNQNLHRGSISFCITVLIHLYGSYLQSIPMIFYFLNCLSTFFVFCRNCVLYLLEHKSNIVYGQLTIGLWIYFRLNNDNMVRHNVFSQFPDHWIGWLDNIRDC